MTDLFNTALLLQQVGTGDQQAADQLVLKYRPLLISWARGRLPYYCRDLEETADLVQETLIIGLRKAVDFKSQSPGSFLAYLRTILLNRIRKQISQHNNTYQLALTQSLLHSQLQQSSHLDTLVEYDRALDQLSEDQKEAVILRVEFGFDYQKIAELTERPSADAARMFVSRALVALAKCMS